MNLMREKLADCRKRRELHQKRKEKLATRMRRSRTYKLHPIIQAKDAKKETIHDKDELTVIGADVEGLYPALEDIEVALICYNAIMQIPEHQL